MANPLDAFKSTPATNDVRIPEVPDTRELVKTHGLMAGLQKFSEEFARWRLEFERILNERLSSPATAEVSDSSTTTETATTETVVESYNDSAIQAHMSATAAHGVSVVAGTSEEQSLEKKTIGVSYPRYGKFKMAVVFNVISDGDTFTIPTGCSSVVASSLEINGTLQIDGELAIV
jgi:hypothetical protein